MRNMLAHGRHRIPPGMLALLVGIIGLAAHSAVLYYALSYKVLTAAVASGAIIWMVIKHLAVFTVLFGPWHTAFRRRFWGLKYGGCFSKKEGAFRR